MQHKFLVEGVSSGEIFYEKDLDCSIETALVDGETSKISNVSMNNIDTTRFCDDPRAQMDGGVKCSVTNILKNLRGVK